MLTLPTTEPAPLTLDQCKAMLAAGRTKVRVRDGHGEAGRRVKIDGIFNGYFGPLVHGTYEIFSVAHGGAGMSTTHGGFYDPSDLIDDNG